MMSNTAGIPAWNSAGVLPPIRPNMPGSTPDRSPYVVDLAVLFDRFATSPERMAILDGLLRFRADLHVAGITSGFQWLDGSFLEQVEALEGRPPRDMDVVTFYELPSGLDQRALLQKHADKFNHPRIKTSYNIDAYFMMLGDPLNAAFVQEISYWYSMWSHRREGLWKGFVQVDLDPSQDDDARAVLTLSGGASHA
ncbi:DUF6932 family protein [Tepidicella baoligensis]|uniref:DUF6932 family protein n=1 Tax=Tepidicella baoligensis TaxID=2707016 RepID=UPI001FE77813|nr:hypothetical protein [Tepidicella baoligensis]